MKFERPGLEMEMRSIIALLVLALSGLGCGEGVTKSKSGNTPTNNTPTNNTPANNTSTNNSTNNTSTNNSTIIPVEGEVVLKVNQAQQVSATSFVVNLQIANGLPESIGISPSLFRLGVGGLEIRSVDLEQSTCPNDALISAGATHQCLIYFNDVEAAPDRLIYVGAGNPVVAEFTPSPCETCGTQNCIDLRSSVENCGTCGNAVNAGETCTDGKVECGAGSSLVEGFCIPDENIELRPLDLNSNQNCFDLCNGRACEGVLFRGTCTDQNPFGGQERIYPGLDFCEVVGSEVSGFADGFGCTVEAVFCTCY